MHPLFKSYKPDEVQVTKMDKVRQAASDFMAVLEEAVPKGPDHSVAVRKLRESVHAANAAILDVMNQK